jgi:hypothetical protein
VSTEIAVRLDGPVSTAMLASVRAVALRIVERPEVLAALAAAESVPPGLVITDETAAIALADTVRSVIEGEKAIDAELKRLLAIPKAMEAVIKGAVDLELRSLVTAKLRGNEARVAWQAEMRRRAAAEEAKSRSLAAEAAAKAAAEAALTGEDAPPPPEVAPVVVPRTVAGGLGKSGTMVRVEPGEIVDFSKVPESWLLLSKSVARAVFLSDEKQGLVKRAAPGESVVWKGVRFESVEGAVNR